MTFTYIGLDLSLTGTGLASFPLDNHGDPDLRKAMCTTIKSGSMKGLHRIQHIADSIRPHIVPFSVIAIEGYSMRSVHRGYDVAEMTGFVKMMLLHIPDITALIVPPMSLKKHATGDGHATKPEMMKHAKKTYLGLPITNDNEADALCLADVARGWHRGDTEAHKVKTMEKIFPCFPPGVRRL